MYLCISTHICTHLRSPFRLKLSKSGNWYKNLFLFHILTDMIGCNFFKGKNVWQSKLKCANVTSKNILLVSSLNIYISLNWLFLGIQKIPVYWVWTIPRYNQTYLQKYKGRHEYIYIFTTREAILQPSNSKITRGFPGGTVVKNPPGMQDMVRCLDQEDPLEEEMATHFSILAWEIPWAEEPAGLHTVQRVAKSLDTTKHKIKVLKPIQIFSKFLFPQKLLLKSHNMSKSQRNWVQSSYSYERWQWLDLLNYQWHTLNW